MGLGGVKLFHNFDPVLGTKASSVVVFSALSIRGHFQRRTELIDGRIFWRSRNSSKPLVK